MSSARLDRILASTSVRLAAVYAALLVVAFMLAGVGAWAATKSAAENQIRERIQLEMDALQEEMRFEGMPGAIAAIRARAARPGALDYRLVDRQGRPVIGDLKVERPHPGWSFLDLPDDEGAEEGGEDFIVLSSETPDGGLLSIGDDLARAERIRTAVLNALLWVGGGALALALAAGLIAARGALRRMDALSETMTRVGAGELAARAPARSGGDDIDRIGRGVNEMLARIDDLVANIRRVSTDIAHDLRTPLTHLRQELETAAAGSDIGALREALKTAQEKVDEVLRIFDAMLRLSEIEAGAARARFGQVDLASLVERVTDAYRPDIEAAGHAFEVGPLDAAWISGDAALVTQALANLLENAIRHSGQGAAIHVRLHGSTAGLRLEVEDRGPGIPVDDWERVLQPFVRLDSSRTSPGAGLGLSIVSAVARLHGARILMEDANPGLRAVLAWS
ncbi:MAG: HAMP domain-containing sensor histidine kinase [Hyphomonadaceae bacterium]|nr:HAMP domain-containing sensor histidine kinase [Hyphomonadaceae bacterium]